MDQQKVALVEALSRKGSAMCRIYIIANATHSKGEDVDAQEQPPASSASAVSLNSIDKVWRDVLRFTDTNDTKVCGSFFFLLNLILSGSIKNISIYSFPIIGSFSETLGITSILLNINEVHFI
jgi:hypothetical protein